MARRGVAQQLQAEIKTDADLEKFLARPGLLVLEVYSEWCGPCLGMVGTLRRIKLEVGGDNLHLAICQSDTVTALKRFNKKSEPTWLFAIRGQAVNIFYGSDAPKLANLIIKELELMAQSAPRTMYNIADLQPVEKEALRIKNETIEKAERIETEKKYKKRIDYLNHCTDLIMENLPDVGVTIFGPQVSRDMFKKLSEPADHLKMQCKDRRYLEVSSADFEVVNYACKNPLSADIIEVLDGKELLVCFWKIDPSSGPIPHVLATYAHELTKERVAPPDEEFSAPHPLPPIISPLKVKFEVEVQEGEVWVEEVSSEEEVKLKVERAKSVTRDESRGTKDHDGPDDDGEEEAIEEEEEVHAVAQSAVPDMTFDLNLGLDDDDHVSEEEVEEEEEAAPPKPITRTKRVKIPPIWVANNRRTHATMVYVFFRSQTVGFLPPDPVPEPPHIIMAFEASKRDDVMEVVEATREDIPQYGIFTSDIAGEAKLITNSIYKYDDMAPSRTDRIVLKVNKVQSNTMLTLVQFEPTYCSSNVNSGRLEALKFFPEDYKTDEAVPPDVQKRLTKKTIVVEPEVVEEQLPSIVSATALTGAPESAVTVAESTEVEPPQPGETLHAEAPAASTDPAVAPTDGTVPPVQGTTTAQEPPNTETAPAPEQATAPEAPTESAPAE
ncbi:uncharacterized protein LOC6564781 isoform X2 [Drosophila grimshawi]|uniref:uncharacterized protein LOC6564781 isoform X2 n=1 Tax=Drosophila grimshawi TaxID=7222 RepID=UPI000C86F13F|nr:uncharacterized protein LOC6564781 isoform X2 [Drosophila grimshawi]